MNSKMLGSALNMTILSISELDAQGRLLSMHVVNESSGRKQTMRARFGKDTIEVEIDNGGAKSKKTLAIPEGARIVEDATATLLSDSKELKVGASETFYILDFTTASLIKNTATYKGQGTTKLFGKDIRGRVLRVEDPRATTTLYFGSKNELLKMEGPFGLEMVPEPKEVAMSESTESSSPDLALAAAVKTDKKIATPWKTTLVRLGVHGLNLENLPSDAGQKVVGSGQSWVVTIAPVVPNKSALVAGLNNSQSSWLQASLHVPSKSTQFVELARSIVGSEKTIWGTAEKIRKHVFSIMTPNAGIGVLRDATEVLQTKEGVCRDYAILTATLMRAANLPCKLASGLVYMDGAFFYHAWVEVFDGRQWFGMDSTTPESFFSATHFKLAEGHVEEAFQFRVLQGASIKVLEVKH